MRRRSWFGARCWSWLGVRRWPAARRTRSLLRPLVALAALAAVVLPGTRGIAASAAWNTAARPLAGLPVALQSQPASCGPAALATLSTWLGAPRSEAELLALTDLGPTGVSLSEFARLAHVVGLPGAWYRVDSAALAWLPAPFVAHLEAEGSADGTAPGLGGRPLGAAAFGAAPGAPAELGHLVVVGAVAHGYVVVGDPAAGALITGVGAFARRFSGRVYLLDDGGRDADPRFFDPLVGAA